MPDRLALFAWLLAFANLAHQTTYPQWLTAGEPLGLAIGIGLTVAAVGLLFRPAAIGLLLALLVLRVAYCAIYLPFLHNHILLEGFVCAGSLAGLVPALLRRRRFSGFDSDERDELFESFAGFVRVALLLVYGFAFLHKLNADFFDLEVGCGAHFLTWASERYPFLPTGAWALASAGVLAVAVEGCIPLLLLFRRTRAAGIAIGFGFHTALGLHPLGIYTFSSLMVVMLFCWTPPGLPAALAAARRRHGRIAAAIPERALFAAGAALTLALAGALIAWKGVTLAKALYAFGLALWVSWTGVLALLYGGALLAERVPEPTAAALLRRIRPTQWALVFLLVVNGMSPYLGLKTRTSFTMHSNLRTEGSGWNHLLLPASMKLFDYQDDLVRVIESDLPSLRALQQDEQALPFFEFRRAVRDEPRDFTVVYRRHGRTLRFEKRDGMGSDPALMEKPVWPLERLLYFNHADTGLRQGCRYG